MIEMILETLKDIAPFIWDILKPVIIALILVFIATWRARKEIENFLLQRALIGQIENIEERNKETNTRATDFLNQTQEILDSLENKPATSNDIESLIKASDTLYKSSLGASRPVATFASWLKISCDAFRNFQTNDGNSQLNNTPIQKDLYGLFMHGASKIENYSAYVIEIPSKLKSEYHNPIKPKFKKYVKGKGVKVIAGISRGVDRDPSSFHCLEFYDDVLKPYPPERVGGAHRRFFQAIGSNPIMLIYLKEYGIYYPTCLEYNSNALLFGKPEILLVHIEPRRKIEFQRPTTPQKLYNLYYSNISPYCKIMHNFRTMDKFKKIFVDSNIDIPELDFSTALDTIEFVGDETIKITVKEDEGKKAFKLAGSKIEKMQSKNICMPKMRTFWSISL